MPLESPLFQSAMELLGHAISHYNQREELDRKLVILHVSNAVELVLKDLLLEAGESIYKNPKETITITQCFETMKQSGMPVPYLNKLELLIDERNAIQHRFGYPNELTIIYYMNISLAFFRQLLHDHYGQELDEVITQFVHEKDLVAFKMGQAVGERELENLRRLAAVHPLGALLAASTHLEKLFTTLYEKIGLMSDFRAHSIMLTMSGGFLRRLGLELPREVSSKLDELRTMRNLAAHGRREATKEDALRAIDIVEAIEHVLDTADYEQLRASTEEYKREVKERRQLQSSQLKPVEDTEPVT